MNVNFFSQEAIEAGFHLDGYWPADISQITVRPESYFFTQKTILISEIYNIIRI